MSQLFYRLIFINRVFSFFLFALFFCLLFHHGNLFRSVLPIVM